MGSRRKAQRYFSAFLRYFRAFPVEIKTQIQVITLQVGHFVCILINKRYHKLKVVYFDVGWQHSGGLINQNYLPDNPEYYHHDAIVHLQDNIEKIEGLEFVFIEL
jgi:hypothetical protein